MPAFKTLSNKVSFPDLEKGILEFWEAHGTFQKSVAHRKDAKPFVFYDGPPFATGLPHYGHLLAGTIKDIIPRYQTMKGRLVERRFGWDCHGLPVEMEIQKDLGLNSNAEIEAFGVAKFNETCRSIVLRYVDEWEATVRRMGRWVDFKNDYKTMNRSFMESVWWVFKSLFDKGLIYEGFKVMPYSWKAGTTLSNFEANLNYRDVQDPAVTVRFSVKGEANTFLLAWTTTPWTLPGNLALCVNPDLDYVKVKDLSDGALFILGATRVSHYYKKETEYEVVSRFKGKDLLRMKYEPLFPFASQEMDTSVCYRVVGDAYVTDGDGTGVVHQAPAYGEDDQRICSREGIPVYDPVDLSGNFTKSVDFVAGKNIKEADKDIIRRLKEEGRLVRQETLTHSYPYCWRTDTPLIYKAISTWFVKVEAIKDAMVAANDKVRWVPAHVGEGRFGNWLAGARDWAISRNRYWGTPIPIWRSDAGDLLCIGSVAELEALTGRRADDLHKHFIDDLVIEKGGKKYRRVKEVLDCWFESGSMPYAQNHYPFENRERVEANFPADFIAEGLDQTRGWFYTLVVLGTALFGKSPFQNVVVNGLILAEDGKKMSKRLKNYPAPDKVLETYGADALRLYLISSAVVRGESLRFSEKGVLETVKSILLPLWNSFTFFSNYAAIDGWDPEKSHAWKLVAKGEGRALPQALDRWILSYAQELVEEVGAAMDQYDLQKAVPPVLRFIDRLTNWYIRLSRRRYWKSESDTDKDHAYATLFGALRTLTRVLAPFTPFIAEELWKHLRLASEADSVHLTDFPVMDETQRDRELEREMSLVEATVGLGRNLRLEHGLKVRQPLPGMTVIAADPKVLELLSRARDLMEDELNLKSVAFSSDEGRFVTLSIKPNFKVLGKKAGPRMKEIAEKLASFTAPQIQEAEKSGACTVALASGAFALSAEDFSVVRTRQEGQVAATENGVTVVLDARLTPELIREGIARDFINLVQKKRKDLDLGYTDRIQIRFATDAENAKAFQEHDATLRRETLCDLVEAGTKAEGWEDEELGAGRCAFWVGRG